MSGYDDSLLDLYMNRRYNFVNPKAGIHYRITSNHENISFSRRGTQGADQDQFYRCRERLLSCSAA
ncbi:MAG: hypothetical protein R2744_03365 [Bacteroidales bacterium]